MPGKGPYYAERSLSAAFYDTVTGANPSLAGDLAIYAGLAPAGGAILEMGVGTGRLALPLAAQGFAVTGVEIAPAMLAQARAKRDELHPEVARRIELLRGDMAALDLKHSYDLVTCAYFGLAHLPRGTAWRGALAVAARHLKPGGLAAFHLPRIEVLRRPAPGADAPPLIDRPTPSGGRLRVFVRERDFDEAAGRLDQLHEYVEFDPRGQVLRHTLEHLSYYWAEPEILAAPEGLTPDRPPIPLGDDGDIHVFLKA